jgi:hypothetical protein
MKEPTKQDAIISLVGGPIRWTEGSDEIEYLSGQTPPTQSEIDTELIRLQAEFNAQEYARNRKNKYDLLNQFELQFDDKENDTTTWDDAINAIKAKYPKP